MTATYYIRQLAADDLERIWLYSFEQWGGSQADDYIRSLLSRFTWIAEQPHIGKCRDDIKPGYYCFPEGQHLIFYTVGKNGIDIIGIPHQSMDIADHF